MLNVRDNFYAPLMDAIKMRICQKLNMIDHQTMLLLAMFAPPAGGTILITLVVEKKSYQRYKYIFQTGIVLLTYIL